MTKHTCIVNYKCIYGNRLYMIVTQNTYIDTTYTSDVVLNVYIKYVLLKETSLVQNNENNKNGFNERKYIFS